jgi:hypothetical protein
MTTDGRFPPERLSTDRSSVELVRGARTVSDPILPPSTRWRTTAGSSRGPLTGAAWVSGRFRREAGKQDRRRKITPLTPR